MMEVSIRCVVTGTCSSSARMSSLVAVLVVDEFHAFLDYPAAVIGVLCLVAA